MEEYIPLELKELTSERIADLFTISIPIGAFAIIVCGLVGFILNKFINIMKG